MSKRDAERLVEEAKPIGYRKLYVISSEGKSRINIAAQQCRALNLAWALSAAQSVSGKRVFVIGAGAAGLSCAAALKVLGAEVGVFDRASAPMHLQLGCHHRFIHPRIVDWPAEHSTMASANL
ncbi:MAG TPA: FAD-dependent oxidoreductase, partial [Polyangiaceae bacterium]